MAKILRPVCLMVILALVLSLGVALAPQAMAKVGGGGTGTLTVTNGIYTLSVEDTLAGSGVGTYTVSTGASHPNPNEDVLYDGAAQSPWSTYLTVRVYSAAAAGTEYVSTSDSTISPSSGFGLVNLDTCSPSVTQVGNIITTTWTTPQEGLIITQVTAIEGTTLADSRVRVTTTVTNERGETPYNVGIRYEWDLMIDGVDEAWFKEINPDGAWTDTEIAYAPPTFEKFETTNDPTAPMFSVFGTVNGPTTFTPAPTPPDRFVYASWSGANGNAFDYTPVPLSGMDSAVLYYWGDSSGNAIELGPGESVSVTQYIYTGCPPPEADFTATPTKGSAPLTVQFTDLSYDDITSWLWHFGDGETSTAQNPSHVYNYAGTYPVTLTVANSCGTDVATDYIEVIEEVAPARLIVRNLQIQPAQAYPGDSVTITADVVNQGGIRGSKDIDLVINGQAEQSTRVGVDPGAAQHITFTTSKTAPGTYEVYIEGQASAFNVLLRPHVTSTAGASGGLDTGAIIAIVVIGVIFLVGIIIVFIRIRR